MLSVILIVTVLICYIVLLVTYKPQSIYNKGMLFAVTLPAHVQDHAEIQGIQARFNRQLTQASLWTIVFIIPLVLLHAWVAYQVIYFFVWMSVFFIVMVIPFRRAFRDTLALKREHEWFVGTRRVIQSDLRVAHLKNQSSASLWLFMIPFAMAIGFVVWAAGEHNQLIGVASGGFVLTIVLLLVSVGMRRMKAQVYSMNSEVNVSLNQSKRRILSYLWLLIAILENIHFPLIYFLITNTNADMTSVWVAIISLFTVIPIGLIYYAYRRINAIAQEVNAQDGKNIYTDDDEYWANGFTYHNPHDKSIFVAKRVGIGETVNTGTVVGKLIVWGLIGVTALIMGVVSFMLIRSELTSPTLMITPEHTIEINYPMYSYEFSVTGIEHITLVDQVPSGTKTNGEGTDKYARGHFRLKELGKSRLYIFKNNPPYIRIKLGDAYIFYNEQDPLLTEQLFVQLQEHMR